jgi:hypothetical protein
MNLLNKFNWLLTSASTVVLSYKATSSVMKSGLIREVTSLEKDN